MKKIILKNKNSEIIVDSNLSYYLFSHFLMFFIEDENKLKNYTLSKDKIKDLYNILENYLNEILEKWYKEPSEKEFQKHSTRYEKVNLNTTTYKINYRMSEIGRLVFLLDKLLKMIDETFVNNEELNIIINDIS